VLEGTNIMDNIDKEIADMEVAERDLASQKKNLKQF